MQHVGLGWEDGYGDEDPLVGRVSSLEPPQEMALLSSAAAHGNLGRSAGPALRPSATTSAPPSGNLNLPPCLNSRC